jgi:hypothetical protein
MYTGELYLFYLRDWSSKIQSFMHSQKDLIFCFAAMLLIFESIAQPQYPANEISNEDLVVKVYLPDSETGFYRATRFDWSGVIGSLRYRGHEYFDPWLDTHDPLVHEAITGPVEAFAPIGFEDAGIGDPFLIIGVGYLKKPDDNPYRFATTYDLVKSGHWKVKSKKDKIRFVQTLKSADRISYKYTKVVKLIKGQPKLVLEHQLKNTGTSPIETTVYNHNFFVIDKEPTGPDIVTKFPYVIQAEGRGFEEMITVKDSTLTFLRNLKKGESVYTASVTGVVDGARDYDFKIENNKTGAGVRITADRPLSKWAYWACHSTACPEPFIVVKAAPGETFSWKIEYEFYIK